MENALTSNNASILESPAEPSSSQDILTPQSTSIPIEEETASSSPKLSQNFWRKCLYLGGVFIAAAIGSIVLWNKFAPNANEVSLETGEKSSECSAIGSTASTAAPDYSSQQLQNTDDYTSVLKSIGLVIVNMNSNRHPSKEKREAAEDMNLNLGPNQTFKVSYKQTYHIKK